jgi:hypothetical protein
VKLEKGDTGGATEQTNTGGEDSSKKRRAEGEPRGSKVIYDTESPEWATCKFLPPHKIMADISDSS